MKRTTLMTLKRLDKTSKEWWAAREEEIRADERRKCKKERQWNKATIAEIAEIKKEAYARGKADANKCLECRKEPALFYEKCNADDIKLGEKHGQVELIENKQFLAAILEWSCLPDEDGEYWGKDTCLGKLQDFIDFCKKASESAGDKK